MKYGLFFKRLIFFSLIIVFVTVGFLYLTNIGNNFRNTLAKTVITTRYQEYAWVFVGKQRSDELIREFKDVAIKN